MARFRNTNPVQGDGIPQLVGKICQVLGGSPTNADGVPALLRKILTAINSVLTGGTLPTSYLANITQTGTDAPVATVFENTLGDTLVFARSGEGGYSVQSPLGKFTPGKTQIVFGQTKKLGDPAIITCALANATTITFDVIDLATVAGADDRLRNTAINILVYP